MHKLKQDFFGEITWLLTCKFRISLTLIICQRCLKSENEEIFMIVSCFSNYFATNRTCAVCTQCDLHITAVYFKRLSTENNCDTDSTEF